MKKYTVVSVLCGLLLCTTVNAHSDHEHSTINAEQALVLAQKSIKRMAFKDQGFDAGKLDDSWKMLEQSRFNLVETRQNSYIIKVQNRSKKETLYLTINRNGRLLTATKSQSAD